MTGGRDKPSPTPAQWQRIQDLLNEALELPAGERTGFVESASGEDVALQAEVFSLLRAHGRGGVLDRPAADLPTQSFRLAPESLPRPAIGTLEAGRRIGHYEILEQIGAGGMGVVYSARDTKLDRTVAIKSLPTLVLAGDEARRRFVREARTAAAINHPNVATTHAVEEFGDALYIVMEFVHGSTLAGLTGSRRPDVDTAIELVAQAAEGLGAAHARGIVHRDIKPSNVLVGHDGRVKVTDFGIAIQMGGADQITRPGGVPGSLAYMSPEQAEGDPPGPQADVWSLGGVLFTLLTGHLPRSRDREHMSGLPPGLRAVVRRAMARDPGERFSSGTELGTALRDVQRQRAGKSPSGPPRRSRRLGMMVGVAALTALVLAGVHLHWQARVRWARAEAIPAIIDLLADQRFLEAWVLAREAEEVLGDDPHLQRLARSATLPRTILSTPEGAGVFIRDYLADSDEWHYLGETPLRDVPVPGGHLRWEVRRDGYHPAPAAFHVFLGETFRFDLRPESEANDMLYVPAGTYQPARGALGERPPPGRLEGFWLDRTEVTNAAYEHFLSSPAYDDSTLWTQLPRDDAGTWQALVSGFVDATGRPGPAGWELGRSLDGTEGEPVRGVSWYEAAAYCAAVGKALPTYYHWVRAAARGVYSEILLVSNFGSTGPATAGSLEGMTRYGHLDMAGNVKEWTWTSTGPGHYILGGAWNEPAYLFAGADDRPPLDRSPSHGFRCARYEGPLDPAVLAERPRLPRSSPVAAVPDPIFDVFRRLYATDDRPLDDTVHSVDTSSPDWDIHLVSFNAAYGGERVLARLYVPKPDVAAPPYQAVVFFPGSESLTLRSSDGITGHALVDFVPRSGRVLILPIYKGTYERYTGVREPGSGSPPEGFLAWRDQVVHWVRDLRRTVDYLETRADIDATRLAYLGLSLGGRYAPLFTAIEDRFDAAVVLAGGFAYPEGLPDEILPVHYAPRALTPTLMVSGREDLIRPLETTVQPMFEALGAEESEKKLVLFPGGHVPPKNDVVRESLDWLDHYLGRVQRVR